MMNSTEKSLPEKLSDDIIAYILEEQLQPNDKLPNESVLSEKMGAGRSSIREAMKLLASRNIVTIRQGSGTYVAASPGVVDDPLGFTFIDDKKKLTLDLLDVRFLSRNIVTIRQGSGTYVAASPGVVDDPLGFTFIDDKKKLTLDLLDVRFLLEPAIAEMAALHAEKTDIRKISALCDEVEALLLCGEDHTGKDIEFHTAIAMSSKNLVVPRLIPVINSSIPLFIQLTNNRLLMAALHAEETDIRKISTLCDEVEALLLRGEDHTGKDIEFHTAIAMSSKNLVVPRLIPVINSSIPLFIQLTNNRLLHETIGTHREITDAIAAHDTLRAKDAMYLHLVYNRRCLLDQKA